MSQDVPQLLSEAVRLHQAGQFAAAQKLYHRVLEISPEHPDALHLLGYATFQSGDAAGGLILIRKAISLNESRADYHCNLGVVLAAMNRHHEAIRSFQTALAIRPNLAEASYNLGMSLQAEKQPDEAVVAYRDALTNRPNWADAQNNLGNALVDLEKYTEAVAAFHQATSLNPQSPEAWFNLGNVLNKLEQSDESIQASRQAISLRPIYPEAHNNLGTALHAAKWTDRAIDEFQLAIRQKPDFADAYLNLCSAFTAAQRYSEAAAAARKAIELNPAIDKAHSTLGSALQALGQTDEAIAAFRESIRRNPKLAESHYNLSMLLLRRGDYAEAWPHYEWRWQIKDFNMEPRQLALPEWNGEDLRGRRIFLHIEQGFGDLIQFVRYVPMVANRGGKVLLECHRELARLISSVPGIETLLPPDSPEPNADLRCPLMSLPRIFGTTIETIPKTVPYLWFSPQMAEEWHKRLGADKQFRVGLIWNGRPRPQPLRSVPIAQLAPLARVPGVKFVSLQFGDAAAQARNAPDGMEIADFHEEIRDFADTAALMANLDLIITIDTAAAHLAGALARPTWLMLCHLPDWRWMQSGRECPWYPTMRLFRQPAPGDWATPIDEIASELRRMAERKTA
jgi:tetratricopeptide (TPR) repeat protein